MFFENWGDEKNVQNFNFLEKKFKKLKCKLVYQKKYN